MVGRLAAGGEVFVSIPNFAHWYPRARVAAGRFDYDQRGLLDVGHVRFFTRRSFERLVDQCGLRIIERETVGSPVDVVERGTASPVMAERRQPSLGRGSGRDPGGPLSSATSSCTGWSGV